MGEVCPVVSKITEKQQNMSIYSSKNQNINQKIFQNRSIFLHLKMGINLEHKRQIIEILYIYNRVTALRTTAVCQNCRVDC